MSCHGSFANLVEELAAQGLASLGMSLRGSLAKIVFVRLVTYP